MIKFLIKAKYQINLNKKWKLSYNFSINGFCDHYPSEQVNMTANKFAKKRSRYENWKKKRYKKFRKNKIW